MTGPDATTAGGSRLWNVAATLLSEAVLGLDAAGRVIGWSEGASRLFGWAESEVLGRQASFLFVGSDALSAAGRAGPAGRATARIRTRGGRVLPVEVATAPLVECGGTCLVLSDRSTLAEAEAERDLAREALLRQYRLWELLQRITVIANEAGDLIQALHRCMLEICNRFDWPFGHAILLPGPGSGAPVHMWFMAQSERVLPVRRAIESGLGTGLLDRAVATGEAVWLSDLGAAGSGPAGRLAADADLRTGFAFPIIYEDEVVAAVEMVGPARSDTERQLTACARHGSVQLGRVVERQRSREQLSHQALHDALTQLPNRTFFVERLDHVLRNLHRTGGLSIAVLNIDLDHFRLINDSLGHDTGDHVLRTVARRLTDAMRPGDTVARFGGDEFIVLCERLPSADGVGDVASHLLDILAEPIDLDGESSSVVTASIGIAIADADSDTQPDHLIRDADAATHRAKEEGRGRFHVFGRALHEQASLKLAIGNELRRAVPGNQLRLVYQPQFRSGDGRLIGVEALARWDNPARGLLAPAEWIPVAEENQIIVPIGDWIINEACDSAARWMKLAETRGEPFKMCVNVSAVQLARPELIDTVVGALRRTGIDPASLCLEVTESVLMDAPGTYLEALLGLKLLGVSLAVDDFGTGYSSLAYLRRFPIDMIKVDKGFVDGLTSGDDRGRAILRAVVALSEALGVTPVAEGVETAEQARLVTASGCYAAQGYFYGRPQSAASITRLLRAQAAV